MVLPHIVCYSCIDVSLMAGKIGNPPARLWVQMQYLTFFPAIAPTLPGIHGSFIFTIGSSLLCFGQSVITIHQQRSGKLGVMKYNKGEYVQFIPKYMAS